MRKLYLGINNNQIADEVKNLMNMDYTESADNKKWIVQSNELPADMKAPDNLKEGGLYILIKKDETEVNI